MIRDKDTGRPIAGIKLKGMVDQERSLVPATGVEATTDAQGRYRLTGLPKAPAYRLFAEAARGQPYTRALSDPGRLAFAGAGHLRHRAQAGRSWSGAG